LNVPEKTLNTSVVAPPMSTPTALIPSRLAIICRMSPTAPGVGMIGASAQRMSLSYPGAWAITCSRNKS
jgi:hypothetical protein